MTNYKPTDTDGLLRRTTPRLMTLGWWYEREEYFGKPRHRARNGVMTNGHGFRYNVYNEAGERVGTHKLLRVAIRSAVALARTKALRAKEAAGRLTPMHR